MGTEIAHEDDVTLRERRDQGLLDPGEDPLAADGAIEDAGCGDSVVT